MNRQKGIYQEAGLEGVVFVLILVVSYALLGLSPTYSLILGLLGGGITYLIKKGMIRR